MISSRILPILLLAAPVPALAQAQHVIASVPVSEATTSGSLAISGSKALLGGASVVTALDRTAHVSLFRSGDLLVCQTSVVHLTSGSAPLVGQQAPLLISLDRGALELHTSISRNDALITPDLRFVSVDTRDKPAPLDLALRITPNGDTCVENRGKKAPTLGITDAFGQSAYLLKPNQHVLFEHGSLKEVVDTETSPCGCPPALSLADAALSSGTDKKKNSDPYPFPAAVSQGLAQPTPPPADKPGQTNVQVTGTLVYDPTAPATQGADTPVPPPTPAPSAKPEAKPGPTHAIGRFFRKIFAR